jgi:hypothetical protein
MTFALHYRRLCAPIALAAVLVLGVWTGLRAMDYGDGFDERNLLAPAVQGRFLPGWYNYPSLSYYVALATVLPDRIAAQAPKAAITQSQIIRARVVFDLLSLLSVVWIYLTARRWSGSSGPSVAAAAFLGLSWEVAYHCRWTAPDTLMMQFAALTLLAVCVSRDSERPGRWLLAAAVAAGLGCGTKYPGGLLFVHPAIAAFLLRRQVPRRILIAVPLAFVLAILAATPALVVSPLAVLTDIRFEMSHYGSGAHGGYSIGPGLEHGVALLRYLCLAAMSPYRPIAFLAALGACFGAVQMLRTDRAWGIALVSFPVLYILYFALQRVMIVRNYVVLMPYLALFAAVGLYQALKLVPHRSLLTKLSLVVVTALFLINAQWLVSSSSSIVHHRPDLDAGCVRSFMAEAPDTRLSPRVAALVPDLLAHRPAPGPSALSLVYLKEVRDRPRWKANRPGLYRVLDGGPNDVNFDYYPSWKGLDRVVITNVREAAELGVKLR